MKIYYSFPGNKNNVKNQMYNFRIQLLYEYHDYIFRIIELKKILKETDSNKKQNISIKINKEQIRHEYISTGDLIRKDCSLCKLVGQMNKYRHYNKISKEIDILKIFVIINKNMSVDEIFFNISGMLPIDFCLLFLEHINHI